MRKLLIGLVFILAAGCSGAKQIPGSHEKADWEKLTSREILQSIEKSGADRFSAQFFLNTTPQLPGMFSRMTGVLFYDRTGPEKRFRIRSFQPFGMDLFDMVVAGEKIAVFVPSRKVLYEGRIGQMDQRDGLGRILTGLMFDPENLRVRSADPIVSKDSLIIPLETGRLVLDRETGLIRSLVQADRMVSYERYERPLGGPPFPSRIIMEFQKTGRRAVCRLDGITFEEIPEKSFELALPEGTRIEPLTTLKEE